MTRIVLVTSLGQNAALKRALSDIRRDCGDVVAVTIFFPHDFDHPDTPLSPVSQALETADLLLVDIRSDCRLGRALPELIAEREMTIVVVLGAGPATFALTRMGAFRGSRLFKESAKPFTIDDFIRTKRFSALTKTLGRLLPVRMLRDMRVWVLAQEYYSAGGSVNLRNLLLLLLTHYGNDTIEIAVEPPVRQPGWGLYLPSAPLYTDRRAYDAAIGHDPAKPTVGVLLHSGMHFEENLPAADALHEHLAGEVNLLLLFSAIEHNLAAMEACFHDIDLLVNMQYFRLWGGPYGGDARLIYDFLRARDVPLLGATRAFDTDLASWRTSTAGLNPIETVLGVTLPELDGTIGNQLVGGLDAHTDPTCGTLQVPAVIPERIDRLANRVRAWLHLRQVPPADKKIALITYNYPPGEENLASAGYLDVFASLDVLLDKLAAAGYQVSQRPPCRELCIEQGLMNSPVYGQAGGIRLPAADYRRWFDGLPASVRQPVIDHWGEPPGTIMTEGDSFVLPVSPCGNVLIGVQPARGIHHDGDTQYHDRDLPPHHQYLAFYWYLREGYQADAVIHFGMHGTLEFTPGKEVALSGRCFPDLLISDLPHLYYYWVGNTSEATIAKRRSHALCISHASPPMQPSGLYERYLVLDDLLARYAADGDPASLAQLQELARELHLPDTPVALRRELHLLKTRLIPAGMHVMDRPLQPHQVLDYLQACVRFERDLPSLHSCVAAQAGLDWQRIRNTPLADDIEQQTRDTIARVLDHNAPAWLDQQQTARIHDTAACLTGHRESSGIIRALSGAYLEPARGGDPIRDPAVYPCGRNMFAFDPRQIPTPAATARGQAAAERLLAFHREQTGTLPQTVALVLWGFETMKTGGDTIAMILALLGVRVQPPADGWIARLELIPLDALKRPRIDVLITMCGIFRDTFGTVMDLLNRAMQLVAAQDEAPAHNYVRAHQAATPDAGAPARLFGPAPGQYATDLPHLIETGDWQKETQLGQEFSASMQYAYRGDQAEPAAAELTRLLATVDLVAQERDNVDYDITDLDHYYEFLGGLSTAAAHTRGERVPVALVDQADDQGEVVPLQQALERGSRSRTLNPRWLDGMLQHAFHGAKKIQDRVQYLLGLAATTGAVDSWLFDAAAERLLFDPEMRQRLAANNPYATRKIGDLLLESDRRGYWQATDQQRSQLRELILQLESDLE